jgi:taurine dioxygenase
MGGEVSGLDLTAPLRGPGRRTAAAMADRLVLFFRDQPLSHEDHIRLAQYFGGVHIAPSTAPWQVPGHPEVTIIHADENSTFVAGEDWHSDMSCDEARRWARSSISTPFRRWAATRCFPTCMPPMTRCRTG